MKTLTLRYKCLIGLMLSINLSVFAQTLTLQQSIELAYKNNYVLQISSLETEGQQLLIKTAKELPKTNLDLQAGKTQTYFSNDYSLGLIQQFAHPKLYQAQANLQKSHVAASKKTEVLRRNEIAGNLKQLYYQLFYYQLLKQVLIQQDSVYRSSMLIAQARYKAGESNALEQLSAEVRLQEISNRLRILQQDEQAAYQSYKLLLNSTQNFRLSFEIPLKKDTLLVTRSFSTPDNPLLSIYEQQTVISQQQTNLEKQKLKPDFRLGVVNQSIEHRINPFFVSAGIGLPIFTGAQKARIEVARINEKIASSNLKLVEAQLNGQLAILKTAYEKHRSSLNYYEHYALPQAELLIRNALKAYKSGEIDYVELVQNNQQAWQIKDSYLLTVLNFNQTIIQIETLLGIE